MRIKGKVVFQNIEMGVWGIVDGNGTNWQPINFPEQLKHEGVNVEVKLKELKEHVGLSMWGKPAKIVAFHTIQP